MDPQLLWAEVNKGIDYKWAQEPLSSEGVMKVECYR